MANGATQGDVPGPYSVVPRVDTLEATRLLPRGDDSSVLGCNRLLDGIAECMTDQDVALLDARRRVGGHSDQRVHQAAQTASRDASEADCEKPLPARAEDALDYTG